VFGQVPSIARLRLISAECLCHIEQRLFLTAVAVNVELMETWIDPDLEKRYKIPTIVVWFVRFEV